jgi:hypothetical protein
LQVVGQRIGGGQDLSTCFDLGGAVAPGGAHEFLDAPAGLALGGTKGAPRDPSRADPPVAKVDDRDLSTSSLTRF